MNHRAGVGGGGGGSVRAGETSITVIRERYDNAQSDSVAQWSSQT